ncbi:MAG TPA: cytochrome b [Magnetospirillaceae bacterium]|nr:cytochrome b [Magnetospirillaceae bacterium]
MSARLDRKTRLLHWSIAAVILGLIAFGLYMTWTEAFPLYHLHKSIGLLVFLAIVPRAVWRLKSGLPQPVRPFSKVEHWGATLVHWSLLACTVAMPLTGMLYSAASGHGFGIFALDLFPTHHDPANPALETPFDGRLADLGQAAHHWIGWTLLGLTGLHVAGALKHHFIDRDRTLVRMLGLP